MNLFNPMIKERLCNSLSRAGRSRLAFTLAEILITLGIIGVVAAMTIPTMINNINQMEYKVAFKKAYSILSQATSTIMSENGGKMSNLCPDGDHNCLRDIYSEHLRVIKSCDSGVFGCFKMADIPFHYLSGAVAGFGPDSSVVLADGISVDFYNTKEDCSDIYFSITRCGEIDIDTNGSKGPNTWGKDLFLFQLVLNGLVPGGSKDDFNCDPALPLSGYGCATTYLMGN